MFYIRIPMLFDQEVYLLYFYLQLDKANILTWKNSRQGLNSKNENS